MGDWEIKIQEHAPERDLAVEAIEARLEESSEQALLAQKAMRVAERELSSLVTWVETVHRPMSCTPGRPRSSRGCRT